MKTELRSEDITAVQASLRKAISYISSYFDFLVLNRLAWHLLGRAALLAVLRTPLDESLHAYAQNNEEKSSPTFSSEGEKNSDGQVS